MNVTGIENFFYLEEAFKCINGKTRIEKGGEIIYGKTFDLDKNTQQYIFDLCCEYKKFVKDGVIHDSAYCVMAWMFSKGLLKVD